MKKNKYRKETNSATKYINIDCSISWICPNCGRINYIESPKQQYTNVDCDYCDKSFVVGNTCP